jgi:phosphate-selective porin OprO/OprP
MTRLPPPVQRTAGRRARAAATTQARRLPAIVAVLVAPAGWAQVPVGAFAGAQVVVEGLVQGDLNWYDNDVANLGGDPGQDDHTRHDLRTAQFYLRGTGPGGAGWVVGYDAKAEKWLDANARIRFGDGERFLQAGQFKQPNGLEALSAARHNDFMSQAMVGNAFAVGRRLGLAYSVGHPFDRTSGGTGPGRDRHGNWGVTASWFGREITGELARGSGYGVRATWAAFNAEDRIVHLGLSYVDHDTPADTVRLRARPNADLTPVRLVDTGSLVDTDRLATLGAEAFWVRGPFKLQGEYMRTRVERRDAPAGDFDARGGYLSALWNITGQTWTYKGGEPATQVGAAAGAGMWQLGVRYDDIDLDDAGVGGGRMDAWTFGVNWYWHAHLKLVFNYVVVDSERAGVEDEPAIAQLRLQVHW